MAIPGVKLRPEKDFQQAVLDYAEGICGWLCYHTHNAQKSQGGYPDLTCCRASRLVFAELKTIDGVVAPDQATWLGILGGVPCVETRLWRDDDDSWADIERTFR